MDPRVRKLAQVLVHYSLKLKKGQLFRIEGEIVTLPLMKAVYEEAITVGAHPYTLIRLPEMEEIFLKHGSDAQLKYISPITRLEVNRMHARLVIDGSANTRYLAGVDPKRQAFFRRAMRPLVRRWFKRMGDKSISWCITAYPTPANAQEADLSLSDYENFVYRAGCLHMADPVKHWKDVAKEQDRLARILNRVDRIHVRSADTDLKMRVKGRKWISCAGTENFPDGEIFTCPIEDSAEGHIRFSYPAVYLGRLVEDVRLEFRCGKVVNEKAGKDLAYLTSMLNVDSGARYIGEFAIGTNYSIDRYSKNILFDEKIGGTCHLAVGASLPEALGKNKSAVHWDMICDLKKNSEITADGKVVYRNGRFVI
ncbi:MAG TPA: aminopeptidase [Candidatus Deferrimicrobium sp.]|nr:aminopeptidase [Candidatus Deferrimicrobium sp.]